MKVLIIEDEVLLADQLADMVTGLSDRVEILAKVPSVSEAKSFLYKNKEKVDLIFSDIQLTDGLSFEIFQWLDVDIPVIFTTAYDQYAIQAFKTTSIDYLLKPIDRDSLEKAFAKYQKMIGQKQPVIDMSMLQQLMTRKSYKSRFMVKIGDKALTIDSQDAILFASIDRATYLYATTGKRYLIDQTIEQLSAELDPEQFFQVNRKYIVNIDGIDHVTSYTNSRMKVSVKNIDVGDLIIVSRERTSSFKNWFGN